MSLSSKRPWLSINLTLNRVLLQCRHRLWHDLAPLCRTIIASSSWLATALAKRWVGRSNPFLSSEQIPRGYHTTWWNSCPCGCWHSQCYCLRCGLNSTQRAWLLHVQNSDEIKQWKIKELSWTDGFILTNWNSLHCFTFEIWAISWGNKLHSIGVREEFKAHKDYKKYKRHSEKHFSVHFFMPFRVECETNSSKARFGNFIAPKHNAEPYPTYPTCNVSAPSIWNSSRS